ncbi:MULTISPECIES: hypothetical protein [Haloarcula]|jgi:hypothetical protein|uniref:Uncharacterized protein n=1 Tax=Haloarcula marismortui ATCC 33800 TaxID=662476 RepID=M0JQU9_9EURY|nr:MULTISPECIES: hypothetical protein [Haloarcula]EMA10010.1 hypothetical protein C436_18366 [Haloarcula sinaiiensis ATCC 33800]QUJ74962.1 hypothetical protein KDQ40_22855 [Haloarcula sinaiiensis ATCC 33800]RLM33063.1 hypothetical protein DVK01_17815 [Haloarcula sp. Atlit-120R]
MGFDDLEDAAAQQDADDADDAGETKSKPMPDTNQTDRQQSEPSTENDGNDWKRRPAFPYDDASQEAIYPRSDTWDEFEDILDFEVKRELRDAGLRDIPKREYHEALLKLAMENPDRLAELVIDGRKS